MSENTTTDVGAELGESRRRHWLYGTNLAVLVLIAVLLVIALNYAAQYRAAGIEPARADLSSAGTNSLSPATRKLLQEIDAKGKDYEVASVFRVTATSTRMDAEQARQLDDLLQEYARRSRHIKLIQTVSDELLEKKVQERFPGERKPYEAVVEEFAKAKGIADQLVDFYKEQARVFADLARGNKDPEVAKVAGTLQLLLDRQMTRHIRDTREQINKANDSVTPNWEAIKTQLSKVLSEHRSVLEQIRDQLPPALAEPLKKAAPEYTAVINKLKGFSDQIEKLAPLKADEVRKDMRGDFVAIFGPTDVKLLQASDLFRRDAGPEGGNANAYVFDGETGISSALLGLIRPDKPKVVFIGYSPQDNMLFGQFRAIADQLKKANFEVLEWSPPGQPTPGQPPQSPTPPAQGKGVVWIVGQPTPSGPMGMPADPTPVVKAVSEHLEQGGNMLFLAEVADQRMSFMGPQAAGFPFAAQVKKFGVQVKNEFTIVQQRTMGNRTMLSPEILFTRYPPHPITKSMQALETLFVAPNPRAMGNAGGPTVVTVDKSNPEAKVILQTDRSADIFAVRTWEPGGKFQPGTDEPSPVPAGVAAALDVGKPTERRIVVLGNRVFADNYFIEPQLQQVSDDRLALMLRFPGNGELFTNSIYWLTMDENRIAASAKATVARRIRDIPDTTLAFIRVGLLFIGLPLLVLVIGGIVYFVRHK